MLDDRARALRTWPGDRSRRVIDGGRDLALVADRPDERICRA
jgi:hypothetical protein